QLLSDGVSQALPVQQPEVHVCEQLSHTLLTQLPGLHDSQALPPDPQRPSWLPGMHTLPWQQPPAQLAALQTHVPPTHARPAPHAAPVLTLPAPPGREPLGRDLHTRQAPPPAPPGAGGLPLQPPAAQQPPGQDAAPPTHSPPEPPCPLAQAAPPPHEQLPAVH